MIKFLWIIIIVVIFGLTSGYIVGRAALGASADLPIRAGIWNLDLEPISSLAFSECDRHGFPCIIQCRDAPVEDVVNACVSYVLCCGRAAPYMEDSDFETIKTEYFGQ